MNKIIKELEFINNNIDHLHIYDFDEKFIIKKIKEKHGNSEISRLSILLYKLNKLFN